MKYIRRILLLQVVLLFSLPYYNDSGISLPAIIGNNMVLQQNFNVPLWGWATPGTYVEVKPEWSENTQSVKAGEDGKWLVRIKTPSAGGPYTIRINDTVLKNVMIGEVWLCSGQSNMEWPAGKALNGKKEAASAKFPAIRFFKVGRQYSDVPVGDCKAKWVECTPETADTISAVGFFFARELRNRLNVPIGLIQASWDGTPAEAWTKNEFLASDTDLQYYINSYIRKMSKRKSGNTIRTQNSPSSLYNGMISPLIPFGMKGVIWYQGEANTNQPDLYKALMTAMIRNWRHDWGQGDFPFLYVQIAPCEYEIPIVAGAIRDAQRKVLEQPNTGMAVTLDIGNQYDIHPLNKQDVAKRLALWAYVKAYDLPVSGYTGPLYKSSKVENGKIRVTFTDAEGGLFPKSGTLSFFQIAGNDRIFRNASASIDGSSVLVSSDAVPDPVAVRYAFNNADSASLMGKEGLPASTFRTDDWPVITDEVQMMAVFDRLKGGFLMTMYCDKPGSEIHYTSDQSDPVAASPLYSGPLIIKSSCTVKARAFQKDMPSLMLNSLTVVNHKGLGRVPVLLASYNPQYPGGGSSGLTDGIRGNEKYWEGLWQGYRETGPEVIVDLGIETTIQQITCGFLEDTKSWIFLPAKVEFFISADARKFKKIKTIKSPKTVSNLNPFTKDISYDDEPVTARFVKVRATNEKLPKWHPGAGESAWVFLDEVIIN